MQAALVPRSDPEDAESSACEAPEAPHALPWRALRMGALALLALVALAGAARRGERAAPVGSTPAGLGDVIVAEGLPEEGDPGEGGGDPGQGGGDNIACPTYNVSCEGCSGQECDVCRAQVDFECCRAQAKDVDGKEACCAGKYPGANKTEECGAGAAAETPAARDGCSDYHESCLTTKCCKDTRRICYVKDTHWASCLEKCDPGQPQPSDTDDKDKPWSCQMVGECANYEENCEEFLGGCCDHDRKCYRKNQHWASCRTSCTPGQPNPDGVDNTPWSCEMITPKPENATATAS